MEVKFKVAMDNEQKKAGNVEEITLNVEFDGVADDAIQKAALAHMVVAWQSQIRSHWTEFIEGKLPTTVTFGIPLFASSRKVATSVTQEAAVTFIQSLTPEKKAQLMAQLAEDE